MAVGTGYQYGPDDIEREYPAFFSRLKGARDVPALVQIPGVVEAQDYANAFIEFGRAKARTLGIEPVEELFTKAEIAAMFMEVSVGRGGSAPQGEFFDNLHNNAEARVARLGLAV